jgi:2-polyprenyl-3-methyl-5-hydroxy-6-metoxy-1,4-benzoquinol methylase
MVRAATLLQWIPKRYRPADRVTLDTEYARGDWAYLSSLNELAHYSIIVGYCRYLNPRSAILDVCCGEGNLQRMLQPSYSRYLGVDLSEIAVARAAPRGDSNTAFVQGDANTFVPDGRFDVIIFNECLGYFERPLAVVRRYEDFLTPGGLFIVSNVVRRRTRPARTQVVPAYRTLGRVSISNSQGINWDLAVLEPPTQAVAS